MKSNSIALVVAAVLLSGCTTHSHMLAQPTGGAAFVSGTFQHEPPTRLMLETRDTRYEASGFVVQKDMNLSELRKRYRLSESRHWDRIVSGTDTDHRVHFVETLLRAQNGQQLTCRLAWPSGEAPAGFCTDPAGKELAVSFQ